MVHSFVKQSGGHIKVYSEVGQGTTFKIYLPRVHQMEVRETDVRSKTAEGGAETILVVEDDQAVQAIAVDMLSSLGYKVLKAIDGQSALSILHSGVQIDLLFTDVIMPGPVQSPDLARRAQAILPKIAVLFTSGYTQNANVHGGRLDTGVELISKPYRREDLAQKVRQVLTKTKAALPEKTTTDTQLFVAAAPQVSCSRILVVEDNPDSLQMLCELLGVLGHMARGVSSAEDALGILRDEVFDVLLTDVGLPGKSGVELAREALNACPSLRIIFSSGYGDVVDGTLAALSLPKPYNLERLMAVLAKVASQP